MGHHCGAVGLWVEAEIVRAKRLVDPSRAIIKKAVVREDYNYPKKGANSCPL